MVIPFAGAPWVVRPMTLRGDLELILAPGVLLLAKKGEFRGGGDSMFSANGVSNLTIRGYGATLRMRKKDYQNPPYTKAEWRMGIAVRGCRNVLIEGVRVESSGGDGFYVDGGGGLSYSDHVTIRNCVSHDNHRQGLSVISAQNLLVENCTFSGTRGTAPEAGIDLEPDTESQRLVNCVIRNCLFENNHGHAILVYMKPFSAKTEPVSIRFENCHSRMTPKAGEDLGGWAGMAVGAVRDDGPGGLVEFINCTTQDSGREGLKIFDKSSERVKVRLENCSWAGAWTDRAPDYGGLRVPVLLEMRGSKVTQRQGGVEFVDCHVYDNVRRWPIAADEDSSDFGVRDVRGLLTVHNPAMLPARFGNNAVNVDLKIVKE
ncbi:MAG: right-handed parallel beta-helix repeat-containing protein [Acidobacteria bacterium]|nr:right-handed parallel beta-helix repeat-containing protein [Acidobacteriota bacterium]